MQKAVHFAQGKSFVILFIIFAALAFTIVMKEVTVTPQNQYQTVVVKKGDTLWQIADTCQSTNVLSQSDFVNWIEKINHLDSSSIYPGEEILIPIKSP